MEGYRGRPIQEPTEIGITRLTPVQDGRVTIKGFGGALTSVYNADTRRNETLVTNSTEQGTVLSFGRVAVTLDPQKSVPVGGGQWRYFYQDPNTRTLRSVTTSPTADGVSYSVRTESGVKLVDDRPPQR